MPDGYLYLICLDCQKHPDSYVQAISFIPLFRVYQDYNGHARWSKATLESWLKRHIEGSCSGARHVTSRADIIDAERIRASTTLKRIVPREDYRIDSD